MTGLIRPLAACSLPLLKCGAALAADAAVPTGITGIGPSMFIFTMAAAVLLTLVFRAATRRLTRHVAERSGDRRLRRILRGCSPRVLSGALLPGAYGGIAKIDHAVLTPNGLICVRALHQQGTVSGAENDAQWTIGDGPARRRCLNPLIQNEGRARALRKAVPDVPVENLLVFTGRVRFTAAPAANVVTLDSLERRLANAGAASARIANPDGAWQRLNDAVLKDADTRKDFAAQISFS